MSSGSGGIQDLGWRGYLDQFHATRSGITESVFAHLDPRTDGLHDWILDVVPAEGLVLDVACGSAPLGGRLEGRWIGLDRVDAELSLARRRDARPLVIGDATALPLVAACADVVVCSMALMLLQPLDRALVELARVLRPGGRFVAVVPDVTPLTIRDRARYARLLVALRCRRLEYPNDLARVEASMRAAGLELVGDERRRFECVVDRPETATLVVESLYLPGVDAACVDRGIGVAQRWVGSTIGVPIRRLVAVRSD
jgi:SAM-dependent methyltransferase